MNFDVEKYFPYDAIRPAQQDAIDFAINAFTNDKKRFVIIEAGTGVGKSAIGLTVGRYMRGLYDLDDETSEGSYFLTTQKILQDQYIKDFSSACGGMRSIKSSSNYQCSFHKKNTCAESLRALKVAEKGSRFWKSCVFNCNYKNAKKDFVESQESVTNFPYFLAETTYSGKLGKRRLLVIDECHNADTELSKFIEVVVTERFAKTVKLKMPEIRTQLQAYMWIKNDYAPKIASHLKHMESMLEKYEGLKEKLNDFIMIAKKFELLDKHLCKVNRFLEMYDKENWVFNLDHGDARKGRRIEFKPIDISSYADPHLFNYGDKVLLMSATILNRDAFCEVMGIPKDDCSFISIPSPFPVKNRPIYTFPIGKMSAANIDSTLPKLRDAVKEILNQHSGEKGIIHCHTFKIANYLKNNIRDKRLLIHNSENREHVLNEHIRSKDATVLLSPSMTEGVDLKGEHSRFQIICKIPYPYLGDKLVKKRMNKWKWWYSMQTAKKVVQATGRSVRSMDDHAVTYILDQDWDRFYSNNRNLFPKGFRDCIK